MRTRTHPALDPLTLDNNAGSAADAEHYAYAARYPEHIFDISQEHLPALVRGTTKLHDKTRASIEENEASAWQEWRYRCPKCGNHDAGQLKAFQKVWAALDVAEWPDTGSHTLDGARLTDDWVGEVQLECRLCTFRWAQEEITA